MKPKQDIGKFLKMATDPERLVCPRCGKNYVNFEGYNGRSYGICDACVSRIKTYAIEQARAEAQAKTAYDKVRQRAYREGMDVQAIGARTRNKLKGLCD